MKKVWGRLATHASIGAMRVLAFAPLRLLRLLGLLLGWLLFAIVVKRRRIVLANLALCFPQQPPAVRRTLARQTFVYFVQAWLDRAWLWHAPTSWVQQRLQLTGAVQALQGSAPLVIFLPHFVGLDAAWAAVALQMPRASTTIYTDQSNRLMDRWILRGRQRFGHLRLFGRIEGVKAIVSALRAGEPLFLLPDMDFGAADSVFVPFYGVPTATVPSLSRFARLGQAQVVPLVPRLTANGYEIEVLPAWENYPSHDSVADAALMNARLEGYINTMPAQYFWVHKRFKTRPAGADSVY